MIVENAWAIPMHLPLGLALRDLAAETGLPTIGHHHDYWWERERFATCVVPEVLAAAFPPDLPNVRHVSINSLAAAQLLSAAASRRRWCRTSSTSTGHGRGPLDASRCVRSSVGSSGCARTRCWWCSRRAWCRARASSWRSSWSDALADPDAVLLITSPAGDEGTEYLVTLERLADRWNVRLRYAADRFAPDLVGKRAQPGPLPVGRVSRRGPGHLPSLYEGFGNALVEALFYGTPVMVNRYSVYDADIRPLGLRMIEIDGAITDATVADVRDVLADPERRASDARHNFRIGREHLGYDVLRAHLRTLLAPPT